MAAPYPTLLARALSEGVRVLDNLSTCVLIVDGRRSLQYVNAAAEALLGVGRNQALARGLSELLWDSSGLDEVIDRALQAGQAYSRRELELHFRQREGALIVDCTVAPYEHEILPQAALIEISDATQHRRLTRETALLNQVGGSRVMIRQLAHEIKNPLGGLRGAAQLLARQLGDPSMREYTSVIISEADRLAGLVDALLGPGRAPRKEPVNIHELLQHVGHLLAADAVTGAGTISMPGTRIARMPCMSTDALSGAGDGFSPVAMFASRTGTVEATDGADSRVLIERDYDPSLPPLMLDRNHIIQVLLNLGRNAMQAIAQNPGGRGRLILRTRALTNVSIGARRHRVVASVQFQDDGPGVPDTLSDTLFYPLVTGRTDGSGLGLAIAQDLVSRHDGLIEFESRAGLTTFTILLPLHVTDTTESP